LHLVEATAEELGRMVLSASIDCAFVDNGALQCGRFDPSQHAQRLPDRAGARST